MKMTKIGLVILGAIAAVGFANPAFAGPDRQAPQKQEKAEKPEKGQQFKGKVDSVDTTANTMTVDSRVIYVSENTKLTKDDKAIKLADIQTGDEVSGTTHQTADGKTEADTVTVGTKEKQEKDKDLK